ncbi:MAG: NAD(P)/FAD-dependent oxidoreductase [Pseudomonadota bacterium]
MSSKQNAIQNVDAVVIGAGFTGLYAAYRLREMGLSVQGFEAGTGIGGTWYWNRYPGARTDSTCTVYQYWFSDELIDEWDWNERFPSQAETERYLNFVADKFDLRKSFQFSARVTAASFDEQTQRWLVSIEDGTQLETQFLVMGTGGLTEPVYPNIPGIEDFEGESFHTSRWPREEVDFSGKRVGVIGTAATGIQVIQTIASKVEHLTVFQRTPNYTIPMRNFQLDDETRKKYREQMPSIKAKVAETFSGHDYGTDPRAFAAVPADERDAIMERLWEDGTLAYWAGSFSEVFTDEEVNEYFSEFAREKIKARINDPAIAEKLLPRDHGFGTRRVPLETNYYEAFNRDNVTLVDVNETPIKSITKSGIKTDGAEFEFDVLIFATGFEVGTGALTRIDIRGRNGTSLKERWAQETETFMGLQVHGYPNMFTVMAPMSPGAAYCNVPTCSQQQVEWITDCINHVREQANQSIEPTQKAQDAWVAHHDEVGSVMLAHKTRSWHMTKTADGRTRPVAYAGGAQVYKQRCDEITAQGYPEFDIR